MRFSACVCVCGRARRQQVGWGRGRVSGRAGGAASWRASPSFRGKKVFERVQWGRSSVGKKSVRSVSVAPQCELECRRHREPVFGVLLEGWIRKWPCDETNGHLREFPSCNGSSFSCGAACAAGPSRKFAQGAIYRKDQEAANLSEKNVHRAAARLRDAVVDDDARLVQDVAPAGSWVLAADYSPLRGFVCRHLVPTHTIRRKHTLWAQNEWSRGLRCGLARSRCEKHSRHLRGRANSGICHR